MTTFFKLCLIFVLPLFKLTAHNTQRTTTPIKHLVVIFQENRPFDHYFGTYPLALNYPGEPPFIPSTKTPTVNGLTTALQTINQNLVQPFRLAPSQANTCNPIHDYTVLQLSIHSGLMDRFVQTSGAICSNPEIVMGYFDGNTVTALWNYAQHFSMSDNFRTTNIGASTAGVINLVSGQTHGAIPEVPDHVVQGTLINDIDPKYDKCSKVMTAELTGLNVGNLLNAAGVTWGWFQGGFADCTASHIGPNGTPVIDYVPHHNPFEYYQSTSNPEHLPPTSAEMIGRTDQANHLYDLADFWRAIRNCNLPSVSFLKARAFQNGHARNSTPLLEQQFLVRTINRLQRLPQWKNMAIIIAYDDSGGFYDHEPPVIVNQSQIPEDALTGPGTAGTNPPMGGYQGRPGYGFRVPLIIISPWAKQNYVDNTMLDQTSILRFIEDNWNLGRIGDFSFDAVANPINHMFDFNKRHLRYLFLNPENGTRR